MWSQSSRDLPHSSSHDSESIFSQEWLCSSPGVQSGHQSENWPLTLTSIVISLQDDTQSQRPCARGPPGHRSVKRRTDEYPDVVQMENTAGSKFFFRVIVSNSRYKLEYWVFFEVCPFFRFGILMNDCRGVLLKRNNQQHGKVMKLLLQPHVDSSKCFHSFYTSAVGIFLSIYGYT